MSQGGCGERAREVAWEQGPARVPAATGGILRLLPHPDAPTLPGRGRPHAGGPLHAPAPAPLTTPHRPQCAGPAAPARMPWACERGQPPAFCFLHTLQLGRGRGRREPSRPRDPAGRGRGGGSARRERRGEGGCAGARERAKARASGRARGWAEAGGGGGGGGGPAAEGEERELREAGRRAEDGAVPGLPLQPPGDTPCTLRLGAFSVAAAALAAAARAAFPAALLPQAGRREKRRRRRHTGVSPAGDFFLLSSSTD